MVWPPRWPPATWQAALIGLALVGTVAGLDRVLGGTDPVKLIVVATGLWPAGIYLYDNLVTRERQVTIGMALTAFLIGAGLPLLALGLLFVANLNVIL